MSSVVISGDTSGAITIAAPAVAGTYTQTLPMITGTLGTLNNSSVVTAATQTSIAFENIPANVRRITLMVNGLSTNSSANILVQLGTGSTSYTTSGYLGSCSYISSTVTTTAFTTGFGIINATGSAAFVVQGSVVLNNLSGNIWVASGVLGESDFARTLTTGGGVTLGAALTAVRLYIDGTQQFDAGSINILYE
jgi:hypothetical protein